MRTIYLIRTSLTPHNTLGLLLVLDGADIVFQCKTLELPWMDNQKNISCVPPGSYPVVFEWSPRFQQNLWELKDVPGRSEVKIHVANFVDQLQGCIAIGDKHVHIDGDEIMDVSNSRKTLKRLHKALNGIEETIIIINQNQ